MTLVRPVIGLALLAAAATAAALTVQSGQSAHVGTLVEQEEAFARAARERGTRAAFLEFLAEDGVIFRPGPVGGRTYWLAAAEDPGVLQWYPSRAAISASGDLGYTLGPWSHGKRRARARNFGHYLTIWQRGEEGQWRATVDAGITHARQSKAPRLFPGVTMHEPNGLRPLRLDLHAIEQRFARDALTAGYEAAAQKAANARSIRMRNGTEPGPFETPGTTHLAAAPGIVVVEGTGESAAADLAYAFGTVAQEDGARGAFVHIWRVLEGAPYLAVDLFVRLPDEKAPTSGPEAPAARETPFAGPAARRAEEIARAAAR